MRREPSFHYRFGCNRYVLASEEDAYKIVSAVMADETVQVNALAELRDASLADLTVQYGTVPLHPGAARWFEENGYDLPESLRPAE